MPLCSYLGLYYDRGRSVLTLSSLEFFGTQAGRSHLNALPLRYQSTLKGPSPLYIAVTVSSCPAETAMALVWQKLGCLHTTTSSKVGEAIEERCSISHKICLL